MTFRRAGERPALSVVGAGRAGSALAVALTQAGYRVRAVASRTRVHAEQLAVLVGAEVAATPLAAARAADVTLLTVPDGAIAPVAATIAASGVSLRGHGIVHCSARLGPDVAAAVRLSAAAAGVLHPLQAMSGAGSAPRLTGAYFRLEASGSLAADLHAMVDALGGHVIAVDPADRDLYHAAAVLAGNAPLVLLATATRLLEEAGVDRPTAHAALGALLEGAAANARRQDPATAMTGPVVRGDTDAVSAHLAVLEAYPDARALYASMTRAMERLLQPGAERSRRPSLHRVA